MVWEYFHTVIYIRKTGITFFRVIFRYLLMCVEKYRPMLNLK